MTIIKNVTKNVWVWLTLSGLAGWLGYQQYDLYQKEYPHRLEVLFKSGVTKEFRCKHKKIMGPVVTCKTGEGAATINVKAVDAFTDELVQ